MLKSVESLSDVVVDDSEKKKEEERVYSS